jgi:glycosyltransferase involved in cell wall biosynthesis
VVTEALGSLCRSLRAFRRPAPRATVILPTFNWASVLPYSIGSVLDQTMADFELLVIGDGCTDESEAVVGAISDPRVRWINLARNMRSQVGPNTEGLRQARGRVIAYIGHDDLWLPRHLEYLSTAIESGAAFAFGQQLRIDPRCSPYLYPGRHWCHHRGGWIPPTATAHGREVVRDLGGWRFPHLTGALDPESDLWARIFDAYGPPTLLQQLTNLKLPAALRHDVYRTRPHHEQARWLARIRAAGDPETALLAACGEPPEPCADPATAPPELVGLAPATAAERQRLSRRFKGLED